MWRCSVLGCVAVLVLVSATRGEGLADLWTAARGKGEYQMPDRTELRTAEKLFQRTLAGKEDVDALKRSWKDLRFELIEVSAGSEHFLVLRELPEHRTGRGFYVFRRGRTPAIAVQAPHATEDLHTGQIALRLFAEGALAAGAWSTLPRTSADLAHLSASYFQAFTRAFATTSRHGVVVQLHGFEAGKRTSTAGKETDVIASNGTKRPPGWVLGIARALRENWTGSLKLYPTDIRELGGTTNAQVQLLQDLGYDGFLHLEMSLAFRKRLLEDRKLREDFLKCLSGSYRKDRSNGDPRDRNRAGRWLVCPLSPAPVSSLACLFDPAFA